jgi:hypothetical protein
VTGLPSRSVTVCAADTCSGFARLEASLRLAFLEAMEDGENV